MNAKEFELSRVITGEVLRAAGRCTGGGFFFGPKAPALTDEGGREFPLRRYRADGTGCRFEVYNCASLAAYNGESSALVDLSAEGGGQALIDCAFSPEESKKVCRHVTGGHANRSLL